MSGDEVLTLRDTLAVHLPWTRLTVLSACETGIAGEQLPDEVISLAAGFLQAGAAAVISSLWAVNDIATALLMARFYETWILEKSEPAGSLRAAQLWIRDTTSAEKVGWCKSWIPEFGGRDGPLTSAAQIAYQLLSNDPPENRDFASPHYWAALSFMGA